jgi:hypothetical protein
MHIAMPFPPSHPSLATVKIETLDGPDYIVTIQRNVGHPTGNIDAMSALILNINGKLRAANNATSASIINDNDMERVSLMDRRKGAGHCHWMPLHRAATAATILCKDNYPSYGTTAIPAPASTTTRLSSPPLPSSHAAEDNLKLLSPIAMPPSLQTNGRDTICWQSWQLPRTSYEHQSQLMNPLPITTPIASRIR